jgi:hypothetical protein
VLQKVCPRQVGAGYETGASCGEGEVVLGATAWTALLEAVAALSAVAEVLAVPHLDEDVLDTGTGESPPRLTCASASRR